MVTEPSPRPKRRNDTGLIVSVRAEAAVVRPLLRTAACLSGERHGVLITRVLSEEIARLSKQKQQRRRQAVA